MAGTVVVKLNWKGGDVARKLRSEVSQALNETGADAVKVAQSAAPRDTGFMANTIEVIEPASPGNLSMSWGNITANYTLWQEIGSRGRSGRYFLRQGAQTAYPGLLRRLRRVIR